MTLVPIDRWLGHSKTLTSRPLRSKMLVKLKDLFILRKLSVVML